MNENALENVVSGGKKSARGITRARILLFSDQGKREQEIADILGISRQTVHTVSKKFNECTGLSISTVLKEQPRSGRPVKIDTRAEANIPMIACSEPPAGRGRRNGPFAGLLIKGAAWKPPNRVLMQVSEPFKKNQLQAWLSEQWCIGHITGDYIWRMEDGLHQYEIPEDPRYPLICFDERPCFLLGDTGGILPMSPGKAKRYHDESEKNDSCMVLSAFDPHKGGRYMEVRDRCTAVDNAQFMHNLLNRHDPHVQHIRLVQDNLPPILRRAVKFFEK